MRETLAKLLFLCSSVKERQGETKRYPPSVWPDHQHILYPSCQRAPPPPPQRLTKGASLTVLNIQPDELPLSERLTRVSKSVCRQDARYLAVPREFLSFKVI